MARAVLNIGFETMSGEGADGNAGERLFLTCASPAEPTIFFPLQELPLQLELDSVSSLNHHQQQPLESPFHLPAEAKEHSFQAQNSSNFSPPASAATPATAAAAVIASPSTTAAPLTIAATGKGNSMAPRKTSLDVTSASSQQQQQQQHASPASHLSSNTKLPHSSSLSTSVASLSASLTPTANTSTAFSASTALLHIRTPITPAALGVKQTAYSRDNLVQFYAHFLRKYHVSPPFTTETGGGNHHPPSCKITTHLEKFESPPRYKNQTFHPISVVEYVLEKGGSLAIDNWSELSRKCGFTDVNKTNIATRIRDWMFAHHVDAFIDFLGGIPNSHFEGFLDHAGKEELKRLREAFPAAAAHADHHILQQTTPSKSRLAKQGPSSSSSSITAALSSSSSAASLLPSGSVVKINGVAVDTDALLLEKKTRKLSSSSSTTAAAAVALLSSAVAFHENDVKNGLGGGSGSEEEEEEVGMVLEDGRNHHHPHRHQQQQQQQQYLNHEQQLDGIQDESSEILSTSDEEEEGSEEEQEHDQQQQQPLPPSSSSSSSSSPSRLRQKHKRSVVVQDNPPRKRQKLVNMDGGLPLFHRFLQESARKDSDDIDVDEDIDDEEDDDRGITLDKNEMNHHLEIIEDEETRSKIKAVEQLIAKVATTIQDISKNQEIEFDKLVLSALQQSLTSSSSQSSSAALALVTAGESDNEGGSEEVEGEGEKKDKGTSFSPMVGSNSASTSTTTAANDDRISAVEKEVAKLKDQLYSSSTISSSSSSGLSSRQLHMLQQVQEYYDDRQRIMLSLVNKQSSALLQLQRLCATQARQIAESRQVKRVLKAYVNKM